MPSHLIISHSTIDFVAIQLLTSPPVTLCCIYIPPSCCLDYFHSALDALANILSHHQNVIILGDFNLPDINWSCLTSPLPTSNLLCDLVFKFNLTQLIHDATHIKENILDLLITNIDSQISNLSVSPLAIYYLIISTSPLKFPPATIPIIMLPNICLTILMVTLKPSTSIFSTLITPSVPPWMLIQLGVT